VLSSVSAAQTFIAKASHNSVGVGERLKVTYTLEGDGNKFVQPTFDGFRLLSGPNTSSNMQWVNGNFSSSKTFSFLLLAIQEGEFTIPAASIKSNGNVIQSNTIKVNVTGGKQNNKGQAQQGNKQQNTASQTTTSDTPDLSTNIFMKLFVNKKSAYVGEQIIATYKLYVNAQIVNYANNRPVYNGFYAEDIELDPNAEITTETLNGKQYRVATMKKVVLTPQKSGDIEVSPLEMEMVVRLENRNKRRSIWDPWGSFKDVKYEIVSNTQTIKVKALPTANQPANFNGAVGSFKLSASSDLEEINVNEAVNLTIKIEGKGNIDLIAEPNFTFPKDFETYEPEVKKNVNATSGGSAGKKTFEYLVIPRYAGEFELPPISMSFFDPSTGSYKSLKTEPISLKVRKNGSAEQGSDQAYIAPKKEDVQIIGNDIRYISTSTEEFQQDDQESFFNSPGFYAMSALPIAAMGLSVLLVGNIRKRDSDIRLVRSRRANAMAKRRLSKARKIIDGENAFFYEEIFKALYGYLSDKLGIEVSDLTKENIDESLRNRSVPNETIIELTKALNECEMARFAPGVVRSKEDMLATSTKIIERIEDVA
jgi:hypothetical protein